MLTSYLTIIKDSYIADHHDGGDYYYVYYWPD